MSQSSTGDLGNLLGLRGRVVRICGREVSLTLVSFTRYIIIVMNVCGSAYENRCVVDGTCATQRIEYYDYDYACHNK